MSVTLQRTRRQRHDDDGALEQVCIDEIVLLLWFLDHAFAWVIPAIDYHGLIGSFFKCGRVASSIYADAVHPFQSSNLFGGIQAIHDRQLDIHQHQVKATFAPFVDGDLAIDGGGPANFQTLEKSFEKAKIDVIVLNNEDVDRWDGNVTKGTLIGCFRAIWRLLGTLGFLSGAWRGGTRRWGGGPMRYICGSKWGSGKVDILYGGGFMRI